MGLHFSIWVQSIWVQGDGVGCVSVWSTLIPVLLNETSISGALQKLKGENAEHSINWASSLSIARSSNTWTVNYRGDWFWNTVLGFLWQSTVLFIMLSWPFMKYFLKLTFTQSHGWVLLSPYSPVPTGMLAFAKNPKLCGPINEEV